MVIMTGNQDSEAPLDEMKEWARYTSNQFYIKEFDADHFFPFNCKKFDEYYLAMIDKADKSSL
jgi:surfactin synthase thioesterase subunit